MIVLDTDHLSLLDRANAEGVRLARRLVAASEQAVATIISFEEQTRGWMAYLAKARSVNDEVEAYRRLERHLDHYRAIAVVGFDEAAAVEFQRLRGLRVRIGTMDLKIAAIVLVHNGLLLSRNLADFRQVPGMRVEDWSR